MDEKMEEQTIVEENEKALLLAKEIKKLRNKVTKLTNEINVKYVELTNVCTHSKIKKNVKYFEGGYLDRAE